MDRLTDWARTGVEAFHGLSLLQLSLLAALGLGLGYGVLGVGLRSIRRAVLMALLLIAAVASGGASEQSPATGAAAVVPGDALAYVHVSIDSFRPAVKRATALVEKLASHIRKEEREVFEGMQRLMKPEELSMVGVALQQSLADASNACILPTAATRLRPKQ